MVKQRGTYDCGIAVVANCCGMSYTATRKRWIGPLPRGGLQDWELLWLLAQCSGQETRKTVPRNPPTIDEFAAKHSTGGRYIVVYSTHFLHETGHAVAIVDGQILEEQDGTAQVLYYIRPVK